jgi:hypothetical protein
MSGALGVHQPQQQWAKGDQSLSWRPQTYIQPQAHVRPPATAYREITLFPQQPITGVLDRPPELPHDPYKTLPPRWSRNDRLNANLNKRERATMFLTETELRRLHRRFEHPAVMRLVKLLKNAGHNDFEERTLEELTKFCHHCQLNSSAPRRFKFTLKDDRHFNYEILVDVMYLGNRPVLHVADASTALRGVKFLSAISAKETWQALRMLWIDTYQGPPDIFTHDADTNFASAEFRAEAKIMGVTCKQVPTEAHWCCGGCSEANDHVEQLSNIKECIVLSVLLSCSVRHIYGHDQGLFT